MQGTPPICRGSTVIRVNRISLTSSQRRSRRARQRPRFRVAVVPASTITPSQRARPVTNRLAALHHDATEPPAGGEIPDAESRDRLAAHADVAEDENDCDVAGAP